jgi:Fe2+ or Zn2+ uptake regulation protein
MIMNYNGKDSLAILQKAGISKTPQRIAVLNTLISSMVPLNINNISQELQSKIMIDRATIYRILSLLKKHMIIREIASTGANYFELATIENPVHPHFICCKCDALSCLDPLTFSQAKSITQDNDFSIEHIEINISGLCADCRNAIKLQKDSDKNEK